MINWFNIPDEGLSNGGLFEVKELEVTENGTYETKGEMYNKVTVNVEGGGGSSDFSTVNVTLVNETAEDFNLNFINVGVINHSLQEEEGLTAVLNLSNGLIAPESTDIGAGPYSTEIYKFILMKNFNFSVGGQNFGAEVPANITISGNAERNYFVMQDQNYGCITITGDCTITIS